MAADDTRPSGAGPAEAPTVSPVSAVMGMLDFSKKGPGKGEDAQPITWTSGEGGAVAVMDGMGGAGAAVVSTDNGDQTQARIAAQMARYAVTDFLRTAEGTIEPSPSMVVAEALAETLRQKLAQAIADYKISASRVRSKLIRTLPTTLALARYAIIPVGVRIETIWAGDSRVYMLTPDGLQQLSEDDLRSGGDALTNIRDDSPLSNMVYASGPFVLNVRTIDVPMNLTKSPLILLAATDGCFGYLPTPWHFEYLLLDALCDSGSFDRWAGELRKRIARVTQDDSTMAFVLIGGVSFKAVKSMFSRRRDDLARQTAEYDKIKKGFGALEAKYEEQKRRLDALVSQTWNSYRKVYEGALKAKRSATTSPRTVGDTPPPVDTIDEVARASGVLTTGPGPAGADPAVGGPTGTAPSGAGDAAPPVGSHACPVCGHVHHDGGSR